MPDHTGAMGYRTWARYVALGDSITEQTREPAIGAVDHWHGWASRLATILDGDARLDGRRVEFTNLARHGERVRNVVDSQVPRAVAIRPDLVSILIGNRDLASRRADPDALAAHLSSAVSALRSIGADVLLVNCFDPQFRFFMRPLRERTAAFNSNIWSIARAHQTYTLDVWSIRELQDAAMWTDDRARLSSAGHRLMANRAAHALGVPYFELPAAETRHLMHTPFAAAQRPAH